MDSFSDSDIPIMDDIDMLNEVLTGDIQMQTSHYGSELEDIFREILGEDLDGEDLDDADNDTFTARLFRPKKSRRRDHRLRRQRNIRREQAFELVLTGMVSSYMDWKALRGDSGWENLAGIEVNEIDGSVVEVEVIDIFSKWPNFGRFCTNLRIDSRKIVRVVQSPIICVDLIQLGLVPCAPSRPQAAFTIRTLEFFRILRVRSPSLSFQQFAKTMFDMHLLPPNSYLQHRLSIAFDLYRQILKRSKAVILKALSRDDPSYRLQNFCPPCTYELQEELPLIFRHQFVVDGNDSGKRVPRREKSTIKGVLGMNTERPDERIGGGDYFLPRDEVDGWGRDLIDNPNMHQKEPSNPCSNRWYNMVHDISSKMWSVYDETGIFVALCRHGFILLVTDMVRSGELYVFQVHFDALLFTVYLDQNIRLQL